jgi:glucan phosphoethanolaminetransferase (alkaline phosphatase superfamily)
MWRLSERHTAGSNKAVGSEGQDAVNGGGAHCLGGLVVGVLVAFFSAALFVFAVTAFERFPAWAAALLFVLSSVMAAVCSWELGYEH